MKNAVTWIGTSWKMNKTLTEAVSYIEFLRGHLRASERLQTFLVLPFTHLDRARQMLAGTGILLGAQNVHWAEDGEFTGEVSARMLQDIGVDLVEIGHSERRRYFGEDDYSVNGKVLAALGHDLIPLICVGENKAEREFQVAREVVGRQLKVALHGVELKDESRILIAYEPVWAIGKDGTPATAAQANEIHSHIRMILVERFGPDLAGRVTVLYGGSVVPENAAEFLAEPAIDGLFVGRAGLDPGGFLKLLGKAAFAGATL